LTISLYACLQSIDFEEFINGLAVFFEGSPEEKMVFARSVNEIMTNPVPLSQKSSEASKKSI
jgi:hypothetical protein